ncbi:hypothetical protein BG22_09310 [Bifidobacterium sp. UTBIF-78]|nr:hypothetical protein BG22_09310 [Bifidobacterium sp. UTBIF-78]
MRAASSPDGRSRPPHTTWTPGPPARTHRRFRRCSTSRPSRRRAFPGACTPSAPRPTPASASRPLRCAAFRSTMPSKPPCLPYASFVYLVRDAHHRKVSSLKARAFVENHAHPSRIRRDRTHRCAFVELRPEPGPDPSPYIHGLGFMDLRAIRTPSIQSVRPILGSACLTFA